jgi:hypothetical protein
MKNLIKAKLLERIKLVDSGCWLWQAKIENTGYGRMHIGNNVYDMAHRVSYNVFKGKIPIGRKRVIDHKCKVLACVNPEHLRLVLQRTNMLNSNNIGAQNSRKTECKNGHPFTKANTYIRPDGARTCCACRAAAQMRYLTRQNDK